MPLKIHQIICTGRFEHEVPVNWKIRKINFFSNVVKLTRFNFTAHITKNISFLFHHNIHNLLKSRIEATIGGEIDILDVKVTNILHSITLNYNNISLIKNFLPALNERFFINSIEVTQEQNAPTKVSLESILDSVGLSYIALNIKVLNKKANIKLQLNKDKQHTHTTIILPNFSSGARSLIDYITTHDGF